jgi:hypothetical protein
LLTSIPGQALFGGNNFFSQDSGAAWWPPLHFVGSAKRGEFGQDTRNPQIAQQMIVEMCSVPVAP